MLSLVKSCHFKQIYLCWLRFCISHNNQFLQTKRFSLSFVFFYWKKFLSHLSQQTPTPPPHFSLPKTDESHQIPRIWRKADRFLNRWSDILAGLQVQQIWSCWYKPVNSHYIGCFGRIDARYRWPARVQEDYIHSQD